MDVIIFIYAVFAMIVATLSYAFTSLGDWGSTEWFYKTIAVLTVSLLANIAWGVSAILSRMEKK